VSLQNAKRVNGEVSVAGFSAANLRMNVSILCISIMYQMDN